MKMWSSLRPWCLEIRRLKTRSNNLQNVSIRWTTSRKTLFMNVMNILKPRMRIANRSRKPQNNLRLLRLRLHNYKRWTRKSHTSWRTLIWLMKRIEKKLKDWRRHSRSCLLTVRSTRAERMTTSHSSMRKHRPYKSWQIVWKPRSIQRSTDRSRFRSWHLTWQAKLMRGSV
jgi:hypothetical protein